MRGVDTTDQGMWPVDVSLPCQHDRHYRCGALLIAGPEHLAWGAVIGCACLCHCGLRPNPQVLTATVIYLPAPPITGVVS